MMSNRGWECPKCGHVYAPHVDECSNCNRPITQTTGTGGIKITVNPEWIYRPQISTSDTFIDADARKLWRITL